jgi:hypothetical protein
VTTEQHLQADVLVVAPALGSHQAAAKRLEHCVAQLALDGVDADGVVGDGDLVQALEDAAAVCDPTVVVLATPPLEYGELPLLVRERFAFPIVHVVIESEVLHAAA